jgi:hypothetical protein
MALCFFNIQPVDDEFHNILECKKLTEDIFEQVMYKAT